MKEKSPDQSAPMEFYWSRLQDLSPLEVHEMFKSREAVFVVEQQCVYQDADDYDLSAWHLFCRRDGKLVAYTRVVDPGLKFPEPSIGRVMTVKESRTDKLGRPLMIEAIRFTEKKFPHRGIKIGAQSYLCNFYSSFGFKQVSEEYDEDGIPHINMLKEPV